jgi:hypothetical protein
MANDHDDLFSAAAEPQPKEPVTIYIEHASKVKLEQIRSIVPSQKKLADRLRRALEKEIGDLYRQIQKISGT